MTTGRLDVSQAREWYKCFDGATKCCASPFTQICEQFGTTGPGTFVWRRFLNPW